MHCLKNEVTAVNCATVQHSNSVLNITTLVAFIRYALSSVGNHLRKSNVQDNAIL